MIDTYTEKLALDYGDELEREAERLEAEEVERDEWIESVIDGLRDGYDVYTRCDTKLFYVDLFEDALGQIEPEDKPRILYGLATGDKKSIEEFNALIEDGLKEIKADWR